MLKSLWLKKWFFTLLFSCICVAAFAQEDALDEGEDFDEQEMEEPAAPPPGFSGGPPSGTQRKFNRGGGTKPSTTANPAFNTAKKRTRPPLSQASIEDITNENYPELIDSFDFPNADIADVVKAISELTGKNFIIDPGLRGKITILAPTQITVAEAYKAFLSALAINGYSIVPSGKFLKIKQGRAAQRDSIEIYSGAYTPNSDQMITRIIYLKYISAAAMNKFISKMQTKDGSIEIYEPTNTLIVSDYGSNVQRILKIIRQLDIPGFEEQLTVIPIRHAKAKDISALIDQIINKGRGKSKSSIPRFRRNSQKGETNAAYSLVIPDERTNSIIVVGTKEGAAKIRNLVKKLDFELNPEDAGGAYVYYVKYGDAEKIANTLNGIAKSIQDKEKKKGRVGGGKSQVVTTGFSGNLFGGDIKITSDKDTNSLIIVGNKQDYEGVKNLLSKIDIPRDQVYVETIIMEMKSDNKNDWGISYYKFDKDSKGLGRVGFGGGNFSAFSDITSQGAILGFGSGESVEINVGGATQTVKTLMGFINFIKSNSHVNVLSTPQILALDNEEAEIEVGEKVPIGSSTNSTAAGTSTSITFQDATIKLTITPFISPKNDSVRMKINQTISQLSNTQVKASNLAQAAVVTTKRAISTNIVVRDGDTAVLGGLMRDQTLESVNKVPILGDIPILGWLFKSKSVEVEKVNLLIFITPKIIRNPADSDLLLGQKLDQRLKFVRDNFGGKDKFGSQVELMDPRSNSAAVSQDVFEDDDFDDDDDEFDEDDEFDGTEDEDL